MSNTNITTSLCAAAIMMAGIAQADIIIPFGSPEFAPKQAHPYSGSVDLGYATKYVSRGMVLQEADTDHVFPFQVTGQYILDPKNAIVAGAAYTRFAANDMTLRSPRTLCDEATGLIEFAHHFSNNTTVAAGYQYVHGGLPGSFHKSPLTGEARDFPMFDSHRSEEHSFVLDVHHDFSGSLKGFFWDSRVQAAFQWETGWWFINTLGYKYDLTDKSTLVVSATWTACANYFDGVQPNGTQGYSLQISAPTMVSKHVRVTPHAGLNFIGNGTDGLNDRSGGNVYRDATFHAGVGVSYVF